MSDRPNILFITSDQQRADCYGFAGRRVKTPHLDRLAAEGTHFDACITPNLVCQPSRASMLTGLLPLTHGVADNGIDLRPETGERGFATALNAKGYDTAFIGKAHFATSSTFAPTGTPECSHSTADFDASWFGPYMGFSHVELMVLGHWFHHRKEAVTPPRGQHFERWVFEEVGLSRHIRPLGRGNPSRPWRGPDLEFRHAGSAAQQRVVRRPHGGMAAGPQAGHAVLRLGVVSGPAPSFRLPGPLGVCCTIRTRWSCRRKAGRTWIAAPGGTGPRSSGNRCSRIRVCRDFRAKLSRVPDQTEAELREMTANYYGMISLIDHSVGRVLVELDRLGMRDNTIVVYSTDHGDLLGDHGLYLKGPTPYEALLRVGLIARGPGIPAGRQAKDPVSTLDLPATFCDYGGTALDERAQSQSLRDLFENAPGAGREVAYSEWNVNASRCGVPLELRTVRTKTAKLTLELNSGAGELLRSRQRPERNGQPLRRSGRRRAPPRAGGDAAGAARRGSGRVRRARRHGLTARRGRTGIARRPC